MRKQKKSIGEKLNKSPINYFSDLFIVAMVLAWIIVLAIMVGFAAYATIAYADMLMWSDIANLVAIPLSAGGAIWMIKNSVQHAIANNQGKQAKMDFPRVNAEGEDDGVEIPIETEGKTEVESEEILG